MNAWDPVETPLELHLAAIEGLTVEATADRLGVTGQTIRNWLKGKRAARRAWEHGQAARKDTVATADAQKDFAQYIFRQLPPELQVLWELAIGDGDDGIDYTVSAGIIGGAGEYARKYLYAHALACSGWNRNQAMQVCGVAYREVQRWQAEDADFLELMHQMEYYRKNFFENQLHNLVARQDGAAVMFVNKTINRDRGYGESVAVNHSGKVTQDHTGTVNQNISLVALGNLNLPIEVLRQVTEAIEASKGQEQAQAVQVKGVDGAVYTLPPGVRP